MREGKQSWNTPKNETHERPSAISTDLRRNRCQKKTVNQEVDSVPAPCRHPNALRMQTPESQTKGPGEGTRLPVKCELQDLQSYHEKRSPKRSADRVRSRIREKVEVGARMAWALAKASKLQEAPSRLSNDSPSSRGEEEGPQRIPTQQRLTRFK